MTMRCPRCGSKRVTKLSQHEYVHHNCPKMPDKMDTRDCYFDDQPEEGGDYDDRDPSRRLERQERRARS